MIVEWRIKRNDSYSHYKWIVTDKSESFFNTYPCKTYQQARRLLKQILGEE